MAKITDKLVILVLAGLLLILPSLVACGGGEDEASDITITIGNLTDQTGASATALEIINKALNDAVEYYNEQGLIPGGAHLKVISYDTAYEPSNDIPGYEWLKSRGADLIITNVPSAPINMKPRVERDQMVLFATAANYDTVYPPGHIFVPATLPEENAYTILGWIAQYDPDFPTGRPAKVGAAGWATSYNETLHEAMKEYIDEHPDKFEWMGSHTMEISFDWQTEVEALKDCDYLMLPVMPVTFVKQYREAGYQGKFLASPAQAAFLGMITDGHLWDELDGTYFILPSGWWNDENEIIKLTKELLFEKHPDSAEEIMEDGASYIAIDGIYQMLDIIADAVEAVGPENFDSQALYAAAQSYSQTVDGVTRVSFSETKRSSIDRVGIYKASGADEDLFCVQDEWYPVIRSAKE